MNKKLVGIFIFIVSCLFFKSHAQDLSDFTRLESKGEIPQDFLVLSSEKIKADQASNKNEELDEDFFISTRYGLDELLLSGQILFNEELSNYVNEVAKYTLRDEPELINELRFYIIKSNEVNAYSTDQGIIFFTTGLLAQLEYEAQLAFIIAHESSHYLLKHVRDGYVESKVIIAENGSGSFDNYVKSRRQLSNYRKENELEADKKGIEIYLASEYIIDGIFTSFEMLLYSYLPFIERNFDSTFFNTEILKIPSVFFPDTTNEISLADDYDDEYHTHPNIKTRIDSSFQVLGDSNTNGRLKYKISETEFKRIRNLARFEGVNLLLSERQYGKALYTIFLLKKEFPNNRFLDLCLVKALYGLTKYKNADRYEEVTEELSEIEGSSFILHYFLEKVDQIELNIIAYRHAYDMFVKYPDDQIFALYEKDLKSELAINSGLDFQDLQSVSYKSYIDEINKPIPIFNIDDSIVAIENSNISRYDKIYLKKILTEYKTKSNDDVIEDINPYYHYGLYDLVNNGKFVNELKEISQREKEKKEVEISRKQARKIKKQLQPKFDKLVIVDPLFKHFEKKDEENYEKQERQKMESLEYLQQDDPNLNLDWVLIDTKLLEEESVVEYNEIGLIYQWRQEVMANDSLQMISSSHDVMQELETKYGTNHFLFVAFIGHKTAKEAKLMRFIGRFYPIATSIANSYIKRKHLSIVTYSISSTSEQLEYFNIETIQVVANSRLIDFYMYHLLTDLNNAK